MSDVSGGGGGIDPTQKVIQSEFKAEMAAKKGERARQISSKEAFMTEVEEAFNPFAADKEIRFKGLKERHREPLREEQLASEKKIKALVNAEKAAERRARDNPDLPAEKLRRLREFILTKGRATAEELLSDVLSFFEDPSLADEALDYLIETTEGDITELAGEAKALLNQRQGREVKAGRNMGPESREYSNQGLGSAQSLRDLYRDITGNPRERNQLFQELSNQFTFEKLKTVIEFLLHSMGSDLKAKGPSIPRGELHRLMTEIRVLLSILGVFNFFKGRIRLITNECKRRGLPIPDDLDFESLSQSFVDLIDDRYPSALKVLSLARQLGIDEEIALQIIVFGQYRDAIREVAPRLYRSLHHRYDLLMAIVEALEDLEDQLEENE